MAKRAHFFVVCAPTFVDSFSGRCGFIGTEIKMKRLLLFLLLTSLLWRGCVNEEDAVIGEESEGGDGVESEGGDGVESEGGDGVGGGDGDAVESEGGDAVEPEGGLPLLTDDTFNDAVKDVDFMVVEFYTPW